MCLIWNYYCSCQRLSVEQCQFFILELYVDVKDLLQIFGTLCRDVKFVNVNTYVNIFVIVNMWLYMNSVYICMKSVFFVNVNLKKQNFV
jgi:hypothetical protein